MYQYIYVQFNFVEKKKSNNTTPWTETRSESCMWGCLKKLDFFILHIITVRGQKKRPKVNECISVANYRTAMIFFSAQ